MFDLSLTPSNASGGPLLDAEELSLQEGLDERRAVHGDEWTSAAVAPVMDLARDELLPAAALSLHQNREIRARNALDLPPKLFHLRTRPDEGRRGNGPGRARRPLDSSEALELEHERRQRRRLMEQLEIPLIESTHRIEVDFQHGAPGRDAPPGSRC